jgi:hypothetical protein
MPSSSDNRGDRLIDRAQQGLKRGLLEVESRILRDSTAFDDPPNWVSSRSANLAAKAQSPVAGATHSPTGRPLDSWNESELSSELIHWILTDADSVALLAPRGLRIWYARLTTPLDLTYYRIPVRIELRYCLVQAPLLLSFCELRALSFRNSTLQSGIDASGIKVRGSVIFEDVAAAGTLHFDSASIEGNVQFAETTLTATDTALALDGANITNSLLLWPKFESVGTQSLDEIRIGGSLLASGATLTSPLVALSLGAAAIRGNLVLNDQFNAAGKIQITNGQIDGGVFCDGAAFTSTGDAILFSTTKVRGDFFLNQGFCCAGEIRILGAEVGGQFNCKRASLNGTNRALLLYGGKIRGDSFFDEGFASAGLIHVESMELGGKLVCEDATISYLSVVNTTIALDFLWTRIRNQKDAHLRLLNVTMKSFRDDRTSWPSQNNLVVNGLSVREIYLRTQQSTIVEDVPLHGTERIDWLRLQGGDNAIESQPWMQIAKLLEEKGYKRASKHMTFELRKQESRLRWKTSRIGLFGRAWDRAFTGLEEQPFRILLSIAVCVTLGSALFWPLQGHFAPTSESAYKTAYKVDGKPGDFPVAYPKFQPVIYALENNLPVIKLGQDDRWAPDARHCSRVLYWLLMLMRWFLIIAGWVQGVVLAAAVGSRFRS